MLSKFNIASVAFFVLVAGDCANAADLPAGMLMKAPAASAPVDWTGAYLGGNVGYSWGNSNWTANATGAAAPPLSGSLNFYNGPDVSAGTGSYFGGFQAGYNTMLPSRVVLGVEADISAPATVSLWSGVPSQQTISSPSIGQAIYGENQLVSGTVRGRLGYAFNNWLVYATGGFAWSYDQSTLQQLVGTPIGGTSGPGTVDSALLWRFGWAAGAGLELPVAPNWTAKAEYLFTGFGNWSTVFYAGAQRFDADLNLQEIRLGLNYRFPTDTEKSAAVATPSIAPQADNWSVHGQATYVSQYVGPFHAPYAGSNSLDPNTGRETSDATLYAGLRLWRGAELWLNPELDQGSGLSGTLGIAGFPSAEAYKVGYDYPYARIPRAFLRQTIDLGGDTQKVEAGINQLAGSQTADRLVFTVGKFGVTDVFDTNKYAHDPRNDFLNWTISDTGTFDYAADAWAYTFGAAVEWYQGPWTLRAGLFDLSIAPNTTVLDPTFGQFQWDGEIERRYDLWGQPGKLAVTGFLSRGRMGNFDDAVQLAALTGGPADIVAVRHYTSRGGISANLEQQISPDLGVFARAGWANGDYEPYEFTDVDRTVAAGLSLAGKQWGRPDDTFGLAGVINGISSAHVAFLNAGGLGILVGDGMLPHPGPEQIIETYYRFPLSFWQVTLDYQFVVNPGYNCDRGPASVFGLRLHAQF
ncbi:MAG: carbohydrate porin [Xanthobacteraceae bacterium]